MYARTITRSHTRSRSRSRSRSRTQAWEGVRRLDPCRLIPALVRYSQQRTRDQVGALVLVGAVRGVGVRGVGVRVKAQPVQIYSPACSVQVRVCV